MTEQPISEVTEPQTLAALEEVEPDAPRVAIIMGSQSDMDTMSGAQKVLEEAGVRTEVRVMSAHRDPATWPERLRELLPMWRLRAPARHDFGRIDEVFPSASYQYVLYGMGFRPDLEPLTPAKLQAAQAAFDEVVRQARRFVPALPGHRSLIDHIKRSET